MHCAACFILLYVPSIRWQNSYQYKNHALNQREWSLACKKVWKINLAQSSEQPLSALFCLPDLWMSAVSLCDPSFSERWTGGGYWWAWRVLSTPYSPAADQSKREGEREGGECGGETKESGKQKEPRWKVEHIERNKPVSPKSESEQTLPNVIVSTGGYGPSWLQQA